MIDWKDAFSWHNAWGLYLGLVPWLIFIIGWTVNIIARHMHNKSEDRNPLHETEAEATENNTIITHISPTKDIMQERERTIYPPSKLEKAGMRFLLDRKLWEVFRNNVNYLLNRHEIYTIGDMLAHDRQYIASLEKVGAKTMENIESFMSAFGLDWQIDVRRYDKSAPFDTKGQRGYAYDTAGLKFLLSRHVWEIFPYTVSSKLQLAGLELMADILCLTKGQISRKPGIGDKTSAILEDYVKDNGLAWGCPVHRYIIDKNVSEWILFNHNSRKHIKGMEGFNLKGHYLKLRK